MRGQRHLDAAFLDAVFIRADAPDVSRVREHAPRMMFEFVPLFEKIIAAMVAHFLNGLAVAGADLRDVRRVNNQFPAVGED